MLVRHPASTIRGAVGGVLLRSNRSRTVSGGGLSSFAPLRPCGSISHHASTATSRGGVVAPPGITDSVLGRGRAVGGGDGGSFPARRERPGLRLGLRHFSSSEPPATCPVTGQGAPSPSQPQQQQQLHHVSPPPALTEDMALGIQSSTALLVRHGLGHRRLVEISEMPGTKSRDVSTLVFRWQKMMEAYLGCQVHVLAGLGYPPDESGIATYNFHLGQLMQTADPDSQERLRIAGRDVWREVLSTAFNVPLEDMADKYLSIVDARNVMHKVSQRMMEPETLEKISKKIATVTADVAPGAELALKHTIVQEILVNEVYLGGDPTLVSECGFGDGEVGYVHMQCAMAEHQSDPLVAQYVGGAMMRILQAAGLDGATMEMAAAAANAAATSTPTEK